MITETTIQTNHIEAVAVSDVRHNPQLDIRYLSEIPKRWYRQGRKAGYYKYILWGGEGIYFGPHRPYNPKSQFLKDGHVFDKPKVTIRMVSGDKYEYYFDTLDEAKTFAHNSILSSTMGHQA